MTGDLEHRQFALQLAERRSWSRHPNRRTRRLPTAAAERPAEPFYTRSSGAASDDNRTASAGHSKQLHACSQRQDAWSVRLVHGYRNRHRRRYPGHRAADRVAAGSASRVTAGSGICGGCYAEAGRGMRISSWAGPCGRALPYAAVAPVYVETATLDLP